MSIGRCSCCGTGTDGRSLETLLLMGWRLTPHGAAERVLLLCPVCAWQRQEAADIVSLALENVYGAKEPPADAARPRALRSWFWA